MNLKELLVEIKRLKEHLSPVDLTELSGIKETVEAVEGMDGNYVTFGTEKTKLWQQIKEELK